MVQAAPHPLRRLDRQHRRWRSRTTDGQGQRFEIGTTLVEHSYLDKRVAEAAQSDICDTGPRTRIISTTWLGDIIKDLPVRGAVRKDAMAYTLGIKACVTNAGHLKD